MKEQDVAQISEQFGIEKSIVEASVQDGTLGARIKDSLSKKVVYDPETFEAFKKNHAAEVTTSYYNDLVEKSKKGDLPTDLYKNIKGAAYQQLERDLAAEHDIKEFKDVKDLIEKVVKKSSANVKQQPEIDKIINDLKEANVRLLKEKEEAVQTVEGKYKQKFINDGFNQVIEQVPFDFSDVKPEELAARKEKAQKMLRSVFQSEYKVDSDDQNRTLVLKGTEVLKNQATLEPRPLKDVLVDLAIEYNMKLISPDTGGQGGKSSGNSSGAKFTSSEEFYDYCKANNIDPTSPQAMKLLRERLA